MFFLPTPKKLQRTYKLLYSKTESHKYFKYLLLTLDVLKLTIFYLVIYGFGFIVVGIVLRLLSYLAGDIQIETIFKL